MVLHDIIEITGTFITEWDSGQQICEAILSTPHTMNLTIQSLVQITKYFKLDGWLLNIENNLPDGNKMMYVILDHIKYLFLDYLTDFM